MKIKLKNFNEKLAKIIKDREDIEIQYEEILENINNLKDGYQEQIQTIFTDVSKPNKILKELIGVQQKEIDAKDVELDVILVR